MELYILDSTYQVLKIVDVFQSLVWHEKIFDYGVFELKINELIPDATYVYKNDAQDLGVIQGYTIEQGSITYRGELSMSLLKNRIITNKTTYNDDVESILKDLVTTYIPFVSVATNLNRGEVITLQTEIGQPISEIIHKLNESSEVFGQLTYDYTTNTLTFDVVEKVEANAFPLSLGYETINAYTYDYDTKEFKNYAYIVGADGVATLDLSSGGTQKRVYVDASSIEKTYDDNGTPITLTDLQYEEALKTKGREALATYQITETIDIDTSKVYNIGEITTFKDEKLGITSVQLITERMFGYEANSVITYLTFGRPKIEILKRIKKEFNK